MEWKQNEVSIGKAEQLAALAQKYALEAKDEQFKEYLYKFQVRVLQQRQNVDLLEQELQTNYQTYLRKVSRVPQAAKKNSVEFAIGTALLSVVGGGFILTAIVMLAMNYMNGFVKGMCLYAGALVILLVSEVLIYRKWQKLGIVLSGMGIGGLYLATILNYISLHNFGMWPAMIIAPTITIMVIVLSRMRDSVLYRVLGVIACYVCMLAVEKGITDIEFIIFSAIILLVNVLYIVIPLQKKQLNVGIVHLFANVIFAGIMLLRLGNTNVSQEIRLGFALCMVMVMHIIVGMLLRYQRKQAEQGLKVSNAGVMVAYGFCAFFSVVMLQGCLRNVAEGQIWMYHMVALMICGICIVTMLALRKYQEKWYIYYFMNYALLISYLGVGDDKLRIYCTLVMLLLVKILSLWKITKLKVYDAFITTLNCIMVFAYKDIGTPYSYLLLAGVVLSVLLISQWRTYHEILLTFTIGIYAVQHISSPLQLPLYVGIMFVGILAFNNVKRWKGQGIMVYNIFALTGQVICFLLLANPVYRNAYIIYLCMVVFGVATIVLTFQEKYRMDFKQKYLIMALFLTYIAFIIKTSLPVMNSILLMLIALICVGIGFAVNKKSVRIYGLVLSLLICGKIVLYDYWGAPTLQKTVLFFVVGVLALMIAGIYIVLEKKNNV